MFDTMTMTKIGGAVFGALLFLLLGNWAASTLYSTDVGGHGDEGHSQGFVIASAEDDHGDEGAAEEDTGPTEEEIAAMLASGDVDAGANVFKKCKACHKLEEGVKAVGPDLYGLVGREVAVRDFSYSNTMADMGGVWDAATLNEFLIDPKGMVPGTKMTIKGLSKPQDRADLIAYLSTIGG